MILVETEEPKTLDDGNLQESNSPLCLPASDAPDLRTEDNSRGPFNVYVDKIRSYFGRKPTSPPSPPASDTPDLQESFDACTRLTTQIKKTGQEVMQVTTVTQTGSEMVRKGLTLCKNLMDKMSAVEELLIRPRAMITYQDGCDALRSAAPAFLDLEKFQEELSAIHNLYVVAQPKKRAKR